MPRRPDLDPSFRERLAKAIEPWESADLALERFPIDEYGDAVQGVKTGLYEAVEAELDALRQETGIELEARTLVRRRQTSINWPDGVRTPSAPFVVHKELAGPDRVNELKRYIKRNGGKPLTHRRFRSLRAESQPSKPPEAWDITFTRKLESLVRSNMLVGVITDRPDWWNVSQVGDETRDAYARILRDLAKRISS